MSNARNLAVAGISAVGGMAPTGCVPPFAGTAAPTGWLLCFGQTVSRTTFAALFAALGTTYGAGDGSTTFALPDFRGRVPGGKDNMGGSAASRLTTAGAGVDGATLGASGGAQTHTLTQAQLPALTFLTNTNTAQGGPSLDFSGPDNLGFYSIGGGTAHNNTQPTIVLNYIIKT
jgi:microcystin-dependent protein